MIDAIVDTSVLIARETGRSVDIRSLPDGLAVSVITIGELRSGVLAADNVETRDRRLSTLLGALSLDPLPVDALVAEAWARLHQELRVRRRRMPVNDSWIAATAIAHGVPVVTQDDDYADVPGLAVVRV
ncbi:MAG TPA: type II toxin-antitoxin system VapC family toxin [Candidatus Limnocylindrales bacterium]|jgi:predicted nucleic acid-binding protein